MTLTNCPCAACTADQQSMHTQPAIVAQVHLRQMLWAEPCRVCHLVQTRYRDENNLPLCLACARIQSAWDALQRVPAYVERGG